MSILKASAANGYNIIYCTKEVLCTRNVKMENKRNILEPRQRLDRTLCLPDLVNEDSIQSLVEDQLVRSSLSGNKGDHQNVVAKRTKEVSNFLEMLRSASKNEMDASKARGSSHTDWKIKQDTDQLRVLYREGPYGTPFHSLLTEGYADGSIDVCLCVSWESTLYKKWWPQYNIPTFKITMSSCLKKVRIGEEISLVRMKVPWPVSDREALLHYFEVEYFKEDVVLVLINSISDIEHIDVSTHGFTRDCIPEAKDTVRVDLVGGFILQKVDDNGTYFRTIMNMDMKMDFVSPSLINFMSRQLIGSGYKLYQKAVGSVTTSDDDYREALKGLMYVRVREGLDAHNKHKTASVCLEEEKHTAPFTVESTIKTTFEKPPDTDDSVCLEEEKHTAPFTEEPTIKTTFEKPPATDYTSVNEIVEEEAEHTTHFQENASMNVSPTNVVTDDNHTVRKDPPISPEVERALGILDRAIAIVRGGSTLDRRSNCSSADQETTTLESVVEAVCPSDEAQSLNDTMDKPSNEDKGPSSVEHFSVNGEAHHDAELSEEKFKKKEEDPITFLSDRKFIGATIAPVQTATLNSMNVCDEKCLRVSSSKENGLSSDTNKKNEKKKKRFCCFSPSLFLR